MPSIRKECYSALIQRAVRLGVVAGLQEISQHTQDNEAEPIAPESVSDVIVLKVLFHLNDVLPLELDNLFAEEPADVKPE